MDDGALGFGPSAAALQAIIMELEDKWSSQDMSRWDADMMRHGMLTAAPQQLYMKNHHLALPALTRPDPP